MNKPLKLIPIGNSTGVILPKDVLARLRVSKGDSLQLVEKPGGTYLRAHNPELERQAAVVREVTQRRRKALRELGK